MYLIISPRLQLSPSPPQHGAGGAGGAREHVSRRARGKKRKHEGASGSSPAYKMSTHAASRGSMSVAEVDPEGNYVVLKNDSQEVLERFSLRDSFSSCCCFS